MRPPNQKAMPDLTSKYVPTNRVATENPNLTFLRNEWCNYRIFALQGGTRSGKTTSAVQFLWGNIAAYSGAEYSIVRATLPALKSTVLRDFIDWGYAAKLYSPTNHNLTDGYYKQNGNLIDFFSAENDEKVRGRKRHVLYLNEGPECDWAVVQQLLWRTSAKIIIDYNPSYPESWVYDNILTRDDCAMIRTTYRDNPHLSAGQLSEIDWMRENDPDGYIVYGLGQRGELKGQIYKNWKEVAAFPTEYVPVYVVDFGFTNDPCFIGSCCHHNRTMWAKEHVYATGMDNVHIGIALHLAGATANSLIVADSAEIKSVYELQYGWALELPYIKEKLLTWANALETPQKNMPPSPSALHMATRCREVANDPEKLNALKAALAKGFNGCLPARKGPDSVDAGIQLVKQFEVLVTKDSVNLWREYRTYRWAEDPKTGTLLNKPVDKNNHGCDAVRYYALSIGWYF